MIYEIDGSTIYNSIESSCWVPWLRFSAQNFDVQRQLFSDGQFAIWDETGQLIGYLSTTRVHWEGDPQCLPSWDELAEPDLSFSRLFRFNGNTLALMSIGVVPANRKINWAVMLIAQAQAYATKSGLEHLIGDFRPSGFGAAKDREPQLCFEDYIHRLRPDGLPQDEWLRSLSRRGMRTYRIDPRAMVIPVDLAQFEQYRFLVSPHRWWRITDARIVEVRLKEHCPDQDIGSVDEIWECGQTGTWYVSRANAKAVYIESNVLGELPIASVPEVWIPKSSELSSCI